MRGWQGALRKRQHLRTEDQGACRLSPWARDGYSASLSLCFCLCGSSGREHGVTCAEQADDRKRENRKGTERCSTRGSRSEGGSSHEAGEKRTSNAARHILLVALCPLHLGPWKDTTQLTGRSRSVTPTPGGSLDVPPSAPVCRGAGTMTFSLWRHQLRGEA